MIRTILASLTGTASDRTVLDASIAVARRFGAHVEALHVKFDPASGLSVLGSRMSWEIARDENERSSRALGAFDEARKRSDLPIADQAASGNQPSLHFREVPGLDLNETPYHGQHYDLLIVGRDAELLSSRIAEILLTVGRPILIAPARPVDTLGEHIAVAWKPGPESARAVTAAAPLFGKAKKVSLISVSEEQISAGGTLKTLNELTQMFAWHGIAAEPVVSGLSEIPIGEAIRATAYNVGADMLVMGAYGHSRLRELVLGGVTRTIIKACEIPVFLFH